MSCSESEWKFLVVVSHHIPSSLIIIRWVLVHPDLILSQSNATWHYSSVSGYLHMQDLPGCVTYIYSCLFRFISFGLIDSITRLDHFVVFHMVPTYLWRGDVLFLSSWRTWLPLDISLIRMSPGYSLDYKILVVRWIKYLLPVCTDHPFLAAKLCLRDHRHFSHTQPSS